jgi:hypothetical protein
MKKINASTAMGTAYPTLAHGPRSAVIAVPNELDYFGSM